MAGHSEKKELKEKQKTMNTIFQVILAFSAIYLLSLGYSVYIREYKYDNWDTIGFGIITLINLICYRMIGAFLKSMFFNYIMDVFIINLAVLLVISFSKKGWYIYFLIPCYICFKIGMYAYNHVKNLDKSDSTTEAQSGKEKQKSKVLKYNR